MKNSSKWTIQPPDLVDCENMCYAIGTDFGCLVDVRIDWRAVGITQVRVYARKSGIEVEKPAIAQALAQFPTKSTTPIPARVWRLLFDLYLQLDAFSKEEYCPSMPTVDPAQFEQWRRQRS